MSRAAVIAGLAEDLAAEAASLREILATVPDETWSTPTPAPGWTIHDQVAHLGHFDGITRLAIARPAEFIAVRDGIPDLQTYVDGVGARYRDRSGTEMTEWWRGENTQLLHAIGAADPECRVPWFGPSMSLPSKITARIMETWAHGQDVVDALGVSRTPTDRIRHVARIGVLALPNSFRTRGREIPAVDVHVELTAPDGATRWTWGEPSASNVVRGDALDFALVVTQRRHVDDTGLEVSGPVATEWMSIAQAFAGPAGAGRKRGQFTGSDSPTTRPQ